MAAERLQKILSRYGLASRREAENWILAARVRLNGEVVTTLGTCADTDRDQIEVDGKLLTTAPALFYVLLHKPPGYLCTRRDPQGRTTIYDLLPRSLHHLFSVGRLDGESSGALLLTNDGALANRWTHPQHHVPKRYQVWVTGHPAPDTLQQWRRGVLLEGKPTLPATVSLLDCQGKNTCLEIVLREGRNRQIRRVALLLGHPVLSLHRLSIGPISLGNLPAGNYKVLSPQVLAI